MRKVCLILAALGAVLSLALGLKWRSDYNATKDLVDLSVQLTEQHGVGNAAHSAAVAEYKSLGTASLMLILAALLAGGAIFLLMQRKPIPRKELIAAGLLALGVVAPLIFSAKTLMTTCFLGGAAGVAYVLSTKPGGAGAPSPAVPPPAPPPQP